ncbi:MAG: DUF695 domain-containing protein [Bacteroidota bacterium]
MSLLKSIFKKKEAPILSYADFWNWFQKNEKAFFKCVKNAHNIEKNFFYKLSPKLDELQEGFYYLTGMYNDTTAELIITIEGVVKNIVFAEELINAAPKIKGWKFTALRQESGLENANISMEGYKFNDETLSFYPNMNPECPDDIDITLVHKDYSEENKNNIISGSYIFLDTYLGELNSLTTIDNINIINKPDPGIELIPIEKLKSFLIWREKEFTEKYDGVRHNTENDNYSIIEAEYKSGYKMIAFINSDLLSWDAKASHPWIATITIEYNGEHNNGMPDEETYPLLYNLEDAIMAELKDYEGYLNIGRQIAKGEREIYFACKEFRKPAKVMKKFEPYFSGEMKVSYTIYKDKYWQSFDRFISDN